jgi:hypothetical protein
MKSFNELQILKYDPAIGLKIEDGIPDCVDMSDYSGPRGLTEILSYSYKASEILELSKIAQALSYSNVQVIRISDEAGEAHAMIPGDFECLEESGIHIFAISDVEVDSYNFADELADSFVKHVTYCESCCSDPWSQFVTYRSAAFHAGLAYREPTWLMSQVNTLPLEEDAWGFIFPATFDQMSAFSDVVLRDCSEWQLTTGCVMMVNSWLRNNEYKYKTIDDLIEGYSCYLRQNSGLITS